MHTFFFQVEVLFLHLIFLHLGEKQLFDSGTPLILPRQSFERWIKKQTNESLINLLLTDKALNILFQMV